VYLEVCRVFLVREIAKRKISVPTNHPVEYKVEGGRTNSVFKSIFSSWSVKTVDVQFWIENEDAKNEIIVLKLRRQREICF
jgi:hypothetical protein